VEVPPQKEVDNFLAPLEKVERMKLCLEQPMTFPSEVAPADEILMEYRYKHCAAMQRAKEKLDQIDKDFEKAFGRSYGGQIEEYRMEDAEIALVTMESTTGTAREAIDIARDKGVKVGLVKVRMFRPFPRERLAQALRGKKAMGAFDRHVSFGWGCGHLALELKTLLAEMKTYIPLLGFIAGTGGADITLDHIERAINLIDSAAQGKPYKEVTWLALE
jgi:pyruvate/2-oxoacid:ferredoxin oxidoreductase alpha subunit